MMVISNSNDVQLYTFVSYQRWWHQPAHVTASLYVAYVKCLLFNAVTVLARQQDWHPVQCEKNSTESILKDFPLEIHSGMKNLHKRSEAKRGTPVMFV